MTGVVLLNYIYFHTYCTQNSPSTQHDFITENWSYWGFQEMVSKMWWNFREGKKRWNDFEKAHLKEFFCSLEPKISQDIFLKSGINFFLFNSKIIIGFFSPLSHLLKNIHKHFGKSTLENSGIFSFQENHRSKSCSISFFQTEEQTGQIIRNSCCIVKDLMMKLESIRQTCFDVVQTLALNFYCLTYLARNLIVTCGTIEIIHCQCSLARFGISKIARSRMSSFTVSPLCPLKVSRLSDSSRNDPSPKLICWSRVGSWAAAAVAAGWADKTGATEREGAAGRAGVTDIWAWVDRAEVEAAAVFRKICVGCDVTGKLDWVKMKGLPPPVVRNWDPKVVRPGLARKSCCWGGIDTNRGCWKVGVVWFIK